MRNRSPSAPQTVGLPVFFSVARMSARRNRMRRLQSRIGCKFPPGICFYSVQQPIAVVSGNSNHTLDHAASRSSDGERVNIARYFHPGNSCIRPYQTPVARNSGPPPPYKPRSALANIWARAGQTAPRWSRLFYLTILNLRSSGTLQASLVHLR